jgi:hypothetical protein
MTTDVAGDFYVLAVFGSILYIALIGCCIVYCDRRLNRRLAQIECDMSGQRKFAEIPIPVGLETYMNDEFVRRHLENMPLTPEQVYPQVSFLVKMHATE